MEKNRGLRPVLTVLTVLFVLNGIWIVARQGIFALIERLSGAGSEPFISFLRVSSMVELILFTGCIALGMLLAAVFAKGRLRAAFFVLSAAWLVPLVLNLLTRVLDTTTARLLFSGLCLLAGYGIMAHAITGMRVIGWICAGVAALARWCSAFSTFSAVMMDRGDAELWRIFFIRTAQLSPVLQITACILQALCMVLLQFALQKLRPTAAKPAPKDPGPAETSKDNNPAE